MADGLGVALGVPETLAEIVPDAVIDALAWNVGLPEILALGVADATPPPEKSSEKIKQPPGQQHGAGPYRNGKSS